ncbi:16S rRNA (cytosine(967)-C(5))-methyltransferase RsmB [Romboutsia sedimentorum]|uniref:16S rRNA (cytosine(967)-C(5))-methyltransferase n=1 Tax=Romboutsia sedimentorum TaxID=1368474 RepID=A0ABT7E867_9FIRM|nr:16S rRNA (cytosine(967)-C(5))-methyltransferase RsmB [Romboutsia sedimentorum]MDK2563124.1 16S rRNA (cytosine(967)-C(5))-methyltransferase RsmB [Romboutsia sedimentorum]MDK2586155.1 16S rRNA (cytosine(967)-C(5))-methyltransferase RsmB [Romboutsia sedimentorum]
MNAREIAFKVLSDIEKNKNYSNMSINKHFKELEIKDQDRGFTTELIYGVIENRNYLDYVMNKLSKMKAEKMQMHVRIFLEMGIYQILFLDSVSDYAAVNETVNLVNGFDKKSSGFVNAILRNVIRQKETIAKVDITDNIMYLSTKYSYKPWMIKNWVEKFGQEFTEDLLDANNEKPSIYIRVNTLKTTREELMSKLSDMNIKCFKISTLEEAIRVENLKNIENNKLFKDGLFTVQDISSMIVGKIVNPKENSRVLDICSAPGGKTTHLATIMNNTGHIVSRDIFEHKIKLINATANRLGLTNIEAQCFDASVLDNDNIDKFDYVLADVPCSGLGIIRRKPEIKYKEKADLKELPSIQSKILKNASKYVKIDGVLVYSTCTIQDVENIDIINAFLKENDNFKLVPIDAVNVDVDNQDKGYLKIYPHIHGMDGFFIAKLIRVR